MITMVKFEPANAEFFVVRLPFDEANALMPLATVELGEGDRYAVFPSPSEKPMVSVVDGNGSPLCEGDVIFGRYSREYEDGSVSIADMNGMDIFQIAMKCGTWGDHTAVVARKGVRI